MDTQKLIALLRATMDPNERKAAEDQLTQVSEAENLRNSQRHVLIRDAMPIQQENDLYSSVLPGHWWAQWMD